MIGNSNDKVTFLHMLLLSHRLLTSLHKVFPNNLSASVKLSKTQISKIIQSGGFFDRRFSR